MRRLILQMGVSIDGYVAALDGWGRRGRQAVDPRLGRAAGAYLMGRVTYEGMAAFWPTSTSDAAHE
jgi:hypothetical protein